MKTQELNLVTQDCIKLTGKSYYPDLDPLGIVCIVHGLGDHFGRYEHVAAFLVEQNYAVFGIDLRGHGKSEGKRGHSPGLNFLLNDVEEILKQARKEYISSPIFLYGHSMGGNLVLNYILRRKSSELAGAIVTSPWLRLSFDPPEFRLKLARFMNRIWPAYSDNNLLDPQDLSHDPEVVQQYQNDPLVHSRITAGLFCQVHQAGIWALENASNLSLPVLLMHGSADKITSPHASEEFAQKSGNKTQLKIWEDFRHETHNELEKNEVLQRIGEWLRNQVKSNP